MTSFRIALGILFLQFTLAAQVNVLTANYGNDRTNANLQETVLTPENVASGRFGKLGSFPVDGMVFGQPLYVSGVTVAGSTLDVVYLATMHNSVYALDAVELTPLWHVSLGPAVPADFNGSEDTDPETGILSTPVIDQWANTIYVVAETLEKGRAIFRLHALDLSNGHEKPGSPVEIKAAVPGGGDTSENGQIAFDALTHLQRPGLLLANGNVYVAFGSIADQWPYHGWIFAYSAAHVQQQVAVFNTTPQGDYGAVWQSGRGLASDEDGSVYAGTGNGDYDGSGNFGESLLKLSPSLRLLDWYTPANWEYLSDFDFDMGSLGAMLVPGTDWVMCGDKFGNAYLADRKNMGHLDSVNAPAPHVILASLYGGMFNTAIWNSDSGTVFYVVDQGDSLKAFRIIDGAFEQQPFSRSDVTADIPFQGMAVSANGTVDAILWMTEGNHDLDDIPGILHAFDALDLSNELWNSEMTPERDRLGGFAKFVAPTVANGRVYVPTFSGALAVYGLLPDPK